MTPPKAQLRFDYQQSLLLGEVRSASPKNPQNIDSWNERTYFSLFEASEIFALGPC